MNVLAIALDVLREARHRRWVLALAIAITLALLALSLTLRMDVVDGALASTRLFGRIVAADRQSPEVVLRPVFRVAAYLIFYGGLLFGLLGCSDFAPSLLSPGRIEPMLALPVRRWELLAGTFLGVLCISIGSALYGAGGLTVVLGAKTGIWSLRPIAAAALAAVAFAPIYAVMLLTALFIRSAALSMAVGCALFNGGLVSSHRAELAPLFQLGWGRSSFEAATFLLPRFSSLAEASANFASSVGADALALGRLLIGFALFTAGVLAIAAWRFEQRDF
jgi:Cu-processing system permease protein